MDDDAFPFTWLFADGDLPPDDPASPFRAHESLMILNTTPRDARLRLDLFWTDRDPTRDITLDVAAERVRCVRLDDPGDIGGVVIPRRTQYAIRLRSSEPVVVQYGRLETVERYALLTSGGYSGRGIDRAAAGSGA